MTNLGRLIFACSVAVVIANGKPSIALATPRCFMGSANPPVTCPGAVWPNHYYPYHVNLSSFATKLYGLPMTTDQARYWVQYAANQWRERTGIQDGLTLSYGTTTGTNALCNGAVADGTNEVVAYAGCRPGEVSPCAITALTTKHCADSTCSVPAITEADICVFGAAAKPQTQSPYGVCSDGWAVALSSFPLASTSLDLVSVLAHEFGHALGLEHDTQFLEELMSDGAFCGDVTKRNMFGNDIEGMRKNYPATSTDVARWREMNNTTTWSGETSVTPVDGVWDALAAVGKSGSGEKVIVSEVSDGGTIIGFNRATYPLTSTSTWDAVYDNAHTWRPFAIAARPLGDPAGELWVAALSLEQQVYSSCPGIRVYRSTNSFNSRAFVDLTASCGSAHEPALAYDKASGRFVLAYVNRADGHIFVQTSTDGLTWTTAQSLNVSGTYLLSIDAPSLTCAATGSQCLLAYLDGQVGSSAGSLPALANQKLTINGSSPYVTVGTRTTNTAVVQTRPPGAGVRTYPSSNDWFLSASFAYDRDTTIPFGSFSWTVVDNPLLIETRRVTFAGVPSSNRTYMWYVR